MRVGFAVSGAGVIWYNMKKVINLIKEAYDAIAEFRACGNTWRSVELNHYVKLTLEAVHARITQQQREALTRYAAYGGAEIRSNYGDTMEAVENYLAVLHGFVAGLATADCRFAALRAANPA